MSVKPIEKLDDLLNLADRDSAGIEQVAAKKIRATPFAWPDPKAIPPRQWLFGRWLLRGEMTTIISPGGVGKSTFVAGVAISIASGRDFLGKTIWEGPRRVWVWNLEDDATEIERSLVACCLHHGITPDECGGRLFADSGLDQRLCTAIDGKDGFQIIEPVYQNLRAEIEAHKVDVLIVDPFVSSHEVDENSNAMIDSVSKRWKQLASETRCAIVLVHHTKKMGGREVTAEDSRGAIAVVNTSRVVLGLNTMTREDAQQFGITDQTERRSIVRVDEGKANRAPPGKAWWMQKVSVPLGNSDEFYRSDDVGAAVHWTPPDPFEDLSTRDLYNVQMAIEAADDERCRGSIQSPGWVGHVIAQALGLDASEEPDKARVKALLRTWVTTDALQIDPRPNPKDRNKSVPYIIVGKWIDPTTLPPLKVG